MLPAENINFIEELVIKQENKEYKIQFGVNGSTNVNEIILKVTPNNDEFFYFINKYSQKELQHFSKIFSMYDNIEEIISFLKTLKLEIKEKGDDISIIFNVFLPNGKNQLIELILKKNLVEEKNIINYLLKENKLLKENISLLKNKIINNENEINLLKEENKKLWDEINKIKESNKVNNEKTIIKNSFDSKIFNSINDIDFILDYIRKNDKSNSFNKIKLLYRGSRDGDRTKTCHNLCDNKKNVLIVIKSDYGYIFGGFCKIGFQVKDKNEYLIDNNCFLFSYNLRKIYPVLKNVQAICYIGDEFGLCFSGSLTFSDNFMSKNGMIQGGLSLFCGLSNEMNGGKSEFKCKDLEVFQLK